MYKPAPLARLRRQTLKWSLLDETPRGQASSNPFNINLAEVFKESLKIDNKDMIKAVLEKKQRE